MSWIQPNHTFTPLKNAQLVDYQCQCRKGVFHVERSEKRLAQHNQIRIDAQLVTRWFTLPFLTRWSW